MKTYGQFINEAIWDTKAQAEASGRLDSQRRCALREMVVDQWFLYPARTSGRLVLQDEWDRAR